MPRIIALLLALDDAFVAHDNERVLAARNALAIALDDASLATLLVERLEAERRALDRLRALGQIYVPARCA